MDYSRLTFDTAFLTESNTYKSWTSTLPQPETSTGPTEVDYSEAKLITANYKYRELTALTDTEIKTIGTTVVKAIEDQKVSEDILVKICRLCLSLKAVNGQSVFAIPIASFANKDASTANSTTFVPSPTDLSKATDYLSTATTKSSSSKSKERQSVSSLIEDDASYKTSIPYIMCSFIKLILKPAVSWKNAIGSIKKQYGVFYGTTSKFVTDFPAEEELAIVVKNAFDTFKPIVNFMACVAGHTDKTLTPNSKEHGMFVYFMGQHLSFAGMHAYPMAIELMGKCKGISPALFLTFLEVEETSDAVKEIHRIATIYDAPSNKARSDREFMWKYCRIIDEGFFLKLQNKRNKEFLFGLAILHERMGLVDNNQYSKPTNMAVLRNQDGLRTDAEEYANLFMFLYKKAAGQAEGATPIAKLRSQMAGERVTATFAAASIPKRKSGQDTSTTKRGRQEGEPMDFSFS